MSAGTSSITIVQARIDMRQDPPKMLERARSELGAMKVLAALWHEFITTYLPLGVLDIFGLHLKATPASRTAHFDSLLSQLAATALDGLASIVTHQILLDPKYQDVIREYGAGIRRWANHFFYHPEVTRNMRYKVASQLGLALQAPFAPFDPPIVSESSEGRALAIDIWIFSLWSAPNIRATTMLAWIVLRASETLVKTEGIMFVLQASGFSSLDELSKFLVRKLCVPENLNRWNLEILAMLAVEEPDMRDALVRANVTKLVVAAIRIFEINKREQEVVPVENRQRSLMSATVQLMDVLCDYGMNLPRIVRHIRKGFLPALFPKLPLLWEVNPTDRDYFSSVFTRLFIDNIDKYSVFDATTNALFRMARKGEINVAFLIRRTPPIVASACDSFISSIEIISRDVAENLVPTFTLTKVCHYTKCDRATPYTHLKACTRCFAAVYCDSVCQRLGRRTHECFPSWTISNVEPPAESLSYRQQWSHRCHITRIAVSWILKARMAEARDQVQNIFQRHRRPILSVRYDTFNKITDDLVFDDEEYDDKPEEVDWTEKPRPMFAKEIDLILSRPEDVVHVFVRYRDEEKVLANIHAYMRKAWFFGPVKPGLRKNGLVFQ